MAAPVAVLVLPLLLRLGMLGQSTPMVDDQMFQIRVLLVLAVPSWGLDRGDHAGDWRGIYSHKNSLAEIMVLTDELRATHAQNLVLPHVRKQDLFAVGQALREAKSFAPESVANIKISENGLNSDIHAKADYRAHLVTVMAKRAVEAALLAAEQVAHHHARASRVPRARALRR